MRSGPTDPLLPLLVFLVFFAVPALADHPSSVYYEDRTETLLDDKTVANHTIPLNRVAQVHIHVSLLPWQTDDHYNDHCETECGASSSVGTGAVMARLSTTGDGAGEIWRGIAAGDRETFTIERPRLETRTLILQGAPQYSGPISVIVLGQTSADQTLASFLGILPWVVVAILATTGVHLWHRKHRKRVDGDDAAVDPEPEGQRGPEHEGATVRDAGSDGPGEPEAIDDEGTRNGRSRASWSIRRRR